MIKIFNFACLPCIEEDQFHIELGTEHEHVLMQFDFRDGGRRQRVTDGNQAEILYKTALAIAAVRINASLQIARAVYHLQTKETKITIK